MNKKMSMGVKKDKKLHNSKLLIKFLAVVWLSCYFTDTHVDIYAVKNKHIYTHAQSYRYIYIYIYM